jgi:hypothetical protein
MDISLEGPVIRGEDTASFSALIAEAPAGPSGESLLTTRETRRRRQNRRTPRVAYGNAPSGATTSRHEGRSAPSGVRRRLGGVAGGVEAGRKQPQWLGLLRTVTSFYDSGIDGFRPSATH